MIILCIMFWWVLVWNCSGAPGGTPSPRSARAGQAEIARPRGSDLSDSKKTALCLKFNSRQAKLIPDIVPLRARIAYVGNPYVDLARGKFSPTIRSKDWTEMRCEATKYSLVHLKTCHSSLKNELACVVFIDYIYNSFLLYRPCL